ncbi:TIGR01777 family oxidoreductase [Aurantibacillus circumpalustris]|uniref:TIGR01777 family oxidoreductase n=1 Tax=Aurantibacillus circumpalustris TaxID=3036359 RepID=UPI00295BFE43|nr:TIGR01777 family oxidoreductase [Aurantibacillus circumpalustris]
MTKILITGGSGLVGKTISELLLKQGHEPRWLSREAGTWKEIRKYKWNLNEKYVDESAFEGVEAVIHLAGAGIIEKRWTDSYKKEIIDSRVKSTQLLFDVISKNKFPIKTVVGSSAVGFYGSVPSEHSFSEVDSAGNDFLAETCVDWEKSYQPFVDYGIRTVIVRTGIVLSNKGGAYAKMKPIFNLGLGAAAASGKQYFPWIHINDLTNIYSQSVLKPKYHGVYNAAASQAPTNKEFSKQLAKSLHKPFFLPNIPEFILNSVLGERAITLTSGLKISNEKIKNTGFVFGFDDLAVALKDLSSHD